MSDNPLNPFEIIICSVMLALAGLAALTIVAIGYVYAWRLFIAAIA